VLKKKQLHKAIIILINNNRVMNDSRTEYYDIFSNEEEDDTYKNEFIFKNKLSNYCNNMTKARERNTIFLLSKVKRYNGELKIRMNEIIDLFADGKIKDVLTAENIIEKLKSTNKRTLNAIDKKIEKIKGSTPIKIRVRNQREEKQKQNAASSRITKFMGNRLAMTATVKETAFNKHIITYIVKPKAVGYLTFPDINAYVAMSFLTTKNNSHHLSNIKPMVLVVGYLKMEHL
jgi:hypothetical protein